MRDYNLVASDVPQRYLFWFHVAFIAFLNTTKEMTAINQGTGLIEKRDGEREGETGK